VRLLLDEMISATVAEQLRARGHDVVAVQDPELRHRRGVDDCLLLDRAAEEHRAVVTDNIPDLVRCHQRRVDRDGPHYGLLLFTNDTFPRHLLAHAEDNDATGSSAVLDLLGGGDPALVALGTLVPAELA
jgi:hypothetical protein